MTAYWWPFRFQRCCGSLMTELPTGRAEVPAHFNAQPDMPAAGFRGSFVKFDWVARTPGPKGKFSRRRPCACLKRERLMDTTRRGFLASTVAASGVAVTQNVAHGADDHAHDHQALPSDPVLRVKSLESLLVEKGLVDPAALDAVVETYERKVGPRNGARVVARAWVDPAYKQRLLIDADAALAELGYGGLQGEHMVAVENTPNVHNMVVCTLCSC